MMSFGQHFDRRAMLQLLPGAISFVTNSAHAQAADKKSFMRTIVGEQDRKNEETRKEIERMARRGSSPFFFKQFPDVIPFGDWDYYYIDNVLNWAPNEGQSFQPVEVPAGFVTDLASIPAIFWSVLPRTGRYAYAAIVHDYLYWFQPVSRTAADNILKIAMQDSKVSPTTVAVIYNGVRVGGQTAWDGNTVARKRGEKRVLREFPQDRFISWSDWHKRADVFSNQ